MRVGATVGTGTGVRRWSGPRASDGREQPLARTSARFDVSLAMEVEDSDRDGPCGGRGFETVMARPVSVHGLIDSTSKGAKRSVLPVATTRDSASVVPALSASRVCAGLPARRTGAQSYAARCAAGRPTGRIRSS